MSGPTAAAHRDPISLTVLKKNRILGIWFFSFLSLLSYDPFPGLFSVWLFNSKLYSIRVGAAFVIDPSTYTEIAGAFADAAPDKFGGISGELLPERLWGTGVGGQGWVGL